MPGIEGGGVTTTARSTCSGISDIGLVSLHAQHAGPLGVDGINRAAERAGHQVPQHRAPDGVGVFGGADDRHGFGGKENVKRLLPLRRGFFLRGVIDRLHDLRYPPSARTRPALRASSTSSEFNSILARHGFDVAVVAGRAKTELLENRDGFRMTLFHVANDHIPADQLIESKHEGAPEPDHICTPPSKKGVRGTYISNHTLSGPLPLGRRHGVGDLPHWAADRRC